MSADKEQPALFNPADPVLRWRLWVRFASKDGLVFHVYWHRIAAWLIALALTGWLAVAGGAWAWLHYRVGFTEARYSDIVFPWNWDQHRRALGEYHLIVGRVALANNEPARALAHLRVGVHRVPDDRAGRRLLAITYIRFGRPEAALSTLIDGATEARHDLEYLKFTCALMQELHNDDRLVELAERLLPSQASNELPEQYLALQAATAHFERGRYDAAEDLLQRWQLSRSVEGEVLLARCDWERGYPDLALLRLENALGRFPRRDTINLQLAHYFRVLGQTARARQHALLRQLDDATGPGPRVDLIYAYHDDGDHHGRDREIDSFLADFAADQHALLLLAWFGADRGEANTVRRAATLAATGAWPADPYLLAETQAEISAGNFAAAHRIAETARAYEAARSADFGTLLSGLDAAALHGLGDPEAAKMQLHVFLSQGRLRAVDALLLARLLRSVGADVDARRVLERAVEVDPRNQAALTELVRLETRAVNRDAIARLLPALLEMRKPSRAELTAAMAILDRPEDEPLNTRIRTVIGDSFPSAATVKP